MSTASIDLGSNVSSVGGTVTSVAMTVPGGYTISGSPVTTNGTLVLALDHGARTSYAPVLQTGFTNTTSNAAKFWRVNGTLWVEGGFMMTGGGGTGSACIITLPVVSAVQLLIDTAQLSTGTTATNAGGPHLGMATWFQAGTGWRPVYATYDTTSTIRFFEIDQVFNCDLLNNNDGFHYLFSVPIVGW